MILIIGKSTLGAAIHRRFPSSIVVGRPEFDFSIQSDCDRLIQEFEPTIVINTVAVNQNHNPWEILTTNFTSVAYLTLKFYEKIYAGQIINISSTSTYWVSYPGIDTGKLCYNISKENLSMFGRHLNRKIIDSNKQVVVSTLEIGKFSSKFNNFQPGIDIDQIVDIIEDIISKPKQQISIIK
jgi:short-subunit dehydrogenase